TPLTQVSSPRADVALPSRANSREDQAMQPMRRIVLAGVMATMATAALAHHGWRWTDGGEFELTGVVVEARLGNPHGLLTVDAEGETWIAEIGQPWRNHQAGLTDDKVQPGAELVILGERSANPDELRMKAEVVIIDGVEHVLYPERV